MDTNIATPVSESQPVEQAAPATQVRAPQPKEEYGKPVPKPEPYISSATKVADAMEDALENDSLANEILDEVKLDDESLTALDEVSTTEIDAIVDDLVSDGEESETSESAEDDSNPPKEKTDELDDLISRRTQKRIDKLTAQEKAALEENAQLKERLSKLEKLIESPTEKAKVPPEEKRLSDAEINRAIAKGIEDGDMSVITDAMNYKIEMAIKDTIKKEQEKTEKATEVATKQRQQWIALEKEYSPDAYQYTALKADPDFNLSDHGSLLFRLADKLYAERGYAKHDNGQSVAVREAYSILLEKKLEGHTPKKETDGLKNRLAKEQRRKTILGGSSSSGEVSGTKQSKPSDDLDDYISSRRNDKDKKLGIA